jgi:general secretion pathway protein N
MRRGPAIGFIWLFTWLLLSLHAAAAATAAVTSDALDAGLADETRLDRPVGPPRSEAVTSVHVAPPRVTPDRTLGANPLWAIPLTRLHETRDRPIFSPSRRPPPPVVASEPAPVSAPPPRREAETPPLSLVGTIVGDEESFGIFLDHASKESLWLKLGEDYQGWKLREIRGGQVKMEKDRQAAELTLPPPGGGQANDQVLVTPINADGSTPQQALRRK